MEPCRRAAYSPRSARTRLLDARGGGYRNEASSTFLYTWRPGELWLRTPDSGQPAGPVRDGDCAAKWIVFEWPSDRGERRQTAVRPPSFCRKLPRGNPVALPTLIEPDGLGQAATAEAHRHRVCALIQIPIVRHETAAPNPGNGIAPDLTHACPAHADRHVAVGMNIETRIRQVAHRGPGRLAGGIVCLNVDVPGVCNTQT